MIIKEWFKTSSFLPPILFRSYIYVSTGRLLWLNFSSVSKINGSFFLVYSWKGENLSIVLAYE